ncbi:MAG: cytochrome c [Thermodesulfobacteriota bacterium]
MTTRQRSGLAFLAILIPVLAAGCGSGPQEDAWRKDPDASLFANRCSHCHSASRPLGERRSAAAWQATVQRMRGKDPNWISAEEANRIAAFLARHRASVNPQ